VIILGRDEHLAFPSQTPPRATVLDPIEIAFETEAVRIRLFGARPISGTDGASRTRREFSVERGLALLAGRDPRAHERGGVRMLHG
jgi:hypothetical protein